MHSDQNYLVDQSLFGSSTMRIHSINNCTTHTQLIFKGTEENLEDKIHMLLNIIGVQSYVDTITLLNIKDGCVAKFKQSSECELIFPKLVEKIKQSNLNITVDWYEPKDDRNVYVRNLPLNFTENDLRDLFQSYGSIISVKVIRKEQNNNSIGFVRYQNKEEAEKAINEINNQYLQLIAPERSVHCELSKVYNAPNRDNQSEQQQPQAQHHQQQQQLHYPTVAYSNNPQNYPQPVFGPSPVPNLILVPPNQFPAMYGNMVPMPIVYGIPQQQNPQQDYAQTQVLYLPFNSYNTQNYS